MISICPHWIVRQLGRQVLCAVGLAAAIAGASLIAEEPASKPLTAVEARRQVGKDVVVEMLVQAAKDRLEKRGEIYLDSELDFRSEQNFAVVISRAGAAALRDAGIANPAEHFDQKTIRATGKVTEQDGVPRIEIDAAQQIQIVETR